MESVADLVYTESAHGIPNRLERADKAKWYATEKISMVLKMSMHNLTFFLVSGND